MTKWVYAFSARHTDGGATDSDILGGKGANLAEMSRNGLPVPPGFTVISQASRDYFANSNKMSAEVKQAVKDALAELEKQTGKSFGDADNPLLISVRSGARVSMPGMMDSVLSLGMNDQTTEGLAAKSGKHWFALDTYRRFVTSFSSIVLGVDQSLFEDAIEAALAKAEVDDVKQLSVDQIKDLIEASKQAILDDYDVEFPDDPYDQLWAAVEAVFKSWMSPRAIVYRAAHALPEDWGTAVNIQAMVFGNMGETSGTGVAFTRNPSTGENHLYGEFLLNAQGEDIVSGVMTPQTITRDGRLALNSTQLSMEERLPESYEQLAKLALDIETHFGDMQDIEFTVEDGKLWLLQTRTGKRSAAAAIRIGVEMADAGIITRRTALMRIDPSTLDQLLHQAIDPKAKRNVAARGLPAAPGATTGAIVFSSIDAQDASDAGQKVILVRPETNPDDIHGMHVAQGVLTSRGGMTSHAAVVARGMGKPCVTGVSSIRIDVTNNTLEMDGKTLRKGDLITLDGNSGEVMTGSLPMVQPELSDNFMVLMDWANAERRMKVRANAELNEDAKVALDFGAEGIGLCRTEHMFLEHDERLLAMRKMIMAQSTHERRDALDLILPMQRDDFVELFSIMHGQPVTIRLLDPPLSEFLPREAEELEEVATALDLDPSLVSRRAEELRDINPILGNRGVRTAISYPEIADMQTRAIFEAAVIAGKQTGKLVVPEIMVPLVSYNAELRFIRDRIDQLAKQIMEENGQPFEYLVGCIIEVPRAAIRADFIAESAEFFSFGTNDLTQTTLGISRDDAAVFLTNYLKQGIVALDPFINLDVEGVGELIRLASDKGRKTRPDIQLAISGEHGGDPVSIDFCEQLGMHYVSCSPYRVPVAILAAAQAAIRHGPAGA